MQDLQFVPMEFIHSLKYMGIGMLGIMIVMGILIGSIILLNKFTNPRNKKDGK